MTELSFAAQAIRKPIIEIICRHAKSDFNALMTAQGMEDAKCSVVSITYVSGTGLMFPWTVWGRYDLTKTDIRTIDAAIERRLFPGAEE